MVSPPPVAVTVRLAPARVAEEDADKVRVVVPPPGAEMLVGAKLAVTPLDSPLTEKATEALKPFTRAVVKVMCPEAPRATLMLVAAGVSVKLGVRTVRLMV